jgi:hypothetical protein
MMPRKALKRGGNSLNWRPWLKGLLSAIIGAVANTITVMIVDPVSFNLETESGKVLSVAIVSAIVAAAMYLKASPLPGNGSKKEA